MFCIEHNWLNNYNDTKPLFYRRYIDNIFCVFNNGNEAMLFYNYRNTRQANIKFSFETEKGQLPFLDVLLTKTQDTCITSTYHKQPTQDC